MNEQESKDYQRTCSEVLIQALEEFGKCEPLHVVVLFVDSASDAVLMRNANHTQTIGLCEFGKEMALRGLFKE